MDKIDRIGLTAFFTGCLVLAFLGGAYIVIARVFPYRYLDHAYHAAWALAEQKQTVDQPFYKRTNEWRDARTDTRGVDIYDPDKAYNGYTLYTSGDQTTAYLIDMHGHVLHQWHIDYSKLWQTNPEGRKALPDKQMYFRKTVLYPNGDLLAIISADGDTPWGYGLVKLDADSHVIWKSHHAFHHDLQITPDGRLFTLTQVYSNRKIPGFSTLKPPWLEDFVVELDPDNGKIINKISVLDALWNSPYRTLIGRIEKYAVYAPGDPLHTNSVEYLGAKLGQAFAPAGGNGNQVLLSLRYPGIVALLDLQSGKITWALRGSWLGQHYARALPNGHFTIFDDLGNLESGNMSRILEIDPQTQAIAWQYEGNKKHPFASKFRGQISTLPNGNRLITESNGGRLFEITDAGEIVWQFYTPVRAGDKDQYIPVVMSAQRIQPDDLDPAFRHSLKTPQE